MGENDDENTEADTEAEMAFANGLAATILTARNINTQDRLTLPK